MLSSIKVNLRSVRSAGRQLVKVSTILPMGVDPVYINRVKQMSDMSYTFEQFEQDKETLLNLIADCEELEMKENGDQFFIQCDEFSQEDYTV